MIDKRKDLRQHYTDQATQQAMDSQHVAKMAQLGALESTIIDAFNHLIRYMDGTTSKTEVVNQLQSISTPDVDKVVMALSKLDGDVLASKIDLKPVVDALNVVKRELSLIPKSHPKQIEQKDSIKVSNLSDVKLDTTDLIKAVQALDLKVDVKAPIINTEKTDLKPLRDVMLDLLKAVNKQEPVVIPKFPDLPITDLSKVEKKLDQSNKHLKEIAEKKFGGGGGGGGNGTPYIDATGNAVNVQLITSTVTPAIKGIPIVNPDGTNIGGGAGGGLTNTELRATAVPVSGTFYQATQPVSGTVNTGLIPTGTVLNTYSVRLTTNTTTTPIASTAYISSVVINSEVAGTTSTVTIQDKQGTPLKLINGLTTVSATTAPVPINFNTPIKMVSGIDIVTAGAVAATVDIWINYFA